MEDEPLDCSTHLHMLGAGIQWILQPLERSGTHGARLWLTVEVQGGQEELMDDAG